MGLLRGVEAQPRFPAEDISDETAELLDLYLLNRDLVDALHVSAETAHLLYRLGHRALALAAAPRFDHADRLAAFSYGIGAFEAVSTFVRTTAEGEPQLERMTSALLIVQGGLEEGFVDTLANAKDRLKDDLPRTTQVIGQSAARFYQNYADYSLTGAAIARELEVQAAA